MSDYPEDWEDFREHALRRDSYRCRNCGSVVDLNVHHIVPLSQGGTNHLDNLVTLCLRCHSGVHPHMRHENETELSPPVMYPVLGFVAFVVWYAAMMVWIVIS